MEKVTKELINIKNKINIMQYEMAN
jgi:hypothetical protein